MEASSLGPHNLFGEIRLLPAERDLITPGPSCAVCQTVEKLPVHEDQQTRAIALSICDSFTCLDFTSPQHDANISCQPQHDCGLRSLCWLCPGGTERQVELVLEHLLSLGAARLFLLGNPQCLSPSLQAPEAAMGPHAEPTIPCW